MISGAHVLLYSDNAEADRAFFRDVLGWRHVDVGHGWLIFALPPSEVAVHPVEGNGAQPDAAGQAAGGHRMIDAALYLMCDDLQAQITWLESKNARCTEVKKEPWGIRTTVRLPSGAEIGLYQPTHPTAV